MRKEMTDPVWRMTQYLYLMSSATEEELADQTGISIKECAKILDFPLPLVRNDIAEMFSFKMVMPLSRDRKPSLQNKSLFETAKDMRGALVVNIDKKMIQKGQADSVRFLPNPRDGLYKIPLTVGEYTACRNYDEITRKKTRKLLPALSIKDSFRSAGTERLTEYLKMILDAMPGELSPNGRWLKLRYLWKRHGFPPRVRPYRVLYDATNNEHALVTLTKEGEPLIIPLSEIDHIEQKELCKTAQPDLGVLEKLHQLWGFEMTDKPVRVRIRFYPEANVQAKVRRDTANRKYARLTEDGDCLVFEDDVYGYEAFRSWVLSYGSSVVVEKPAKLRNEIIREMKKIREDIMEKETER